MSSGSRPLADELESFDKRKIHFKSAEAYFYLAYRNNEIVGQFQQLSIGAK
jgi:hypothetical protein